MDDADSTPLSDDEFERALTDHDLRDEVDPDEGTWGWTPGRVFAALGVLAMVGFWVWAFSPLAPRGHPDELDDPSFSDAAEQQCAAVLARIEAEIPAANEARDALDRASQIERSSDLFAGLLTDLRTMAPARTTRDGDLVHRWLDDWQTYLGDRYAYAADFRNGIDGPLSVTSIQGGQITDPIDSFANANAMPSCASPTDV